MKASLAKQIIGNIIEWQLVLSNAKDRDKIKLYDIDLRLYSLSDFMEANRVLHICNKKARISSDTHWRKGKKSTFRQFMTVEDRVLAAVYTTINYDTQNQVVAAYNDKGTAVLNLKYS